MLKQSNLIKADRRTLNSYDMLYNQVSRKPFFTQQDWITSANNGSLNAYIDALQKSDKIDYESFKDKYNLDYADSSTRIMALYNETGADRMNNDTKRKRTISNPDGTITEEEYMASDYEYNLSLIRKQNDYNQQMRQREIAQDIKDSMTAGDHIGGVITGSVTSLTGGVLNAIDNMTALLGATGEAILSESGKLDKFVESVASDRYRAFSGVIEELVNFETNFTSIRDIDGNYTNYGKYIGGTLNSLGEMLPSMLIGYGVGTAAGALGATGKVASTISTIASQGSFYAGMASANIQDMYKQFEAAGADISSAAILSNAAIKSALQWGVEKALGKIMGSTSLDNMVFGVASKGATAKSLTKAGIKTLFKDVVQEGLEEVLQDTSDFLVDQAYGVYINEFKDVTQISFQSLFDAFVIGGLMSFAGSARNILSTRNVYAGDTKLNKLASWQYGLNLESFAKSLDTIQKAAYHVGPNGEYEMNRYLDKKDMNIVRAAVLESYAAYRMVTSVYESIGEERFKAANEILDKITNKINSGFFYIQTADEYVNTIKKNISEFAAEGIKKTIEKAADELKESGVSEVKDVVEKESKSTDKKKTKAKEVAETLKVNKVAVTDGDTFVEKDGTLFIDENKLTKSTGELLKAKAFQILVDKVNTNFAKDNVVKQLTETYKTYTGCDSVKSKEVITALFYDKDFFSSTLLDGNKDVYKFLSYFVELGNKLRDSDTFEKIQKYAITRIINNWTESLTEYCIIHAQADPNLFLYAVKDTDKRKALSDRIKRERWGGEVYNTVILNGANKLSATDTQALKNRFYKAFPENIANKHWENINSEDSKVRQSSMMALRVKYESVFSNNYDGVTYMEDISIGNRVFNRFLQSANLTLKTVFDVNYLTDADKKSIVDEYGEINQNSILKLRQKQFAAYRNDYTISINKAGNIEVIYKDKVVGFSKLKKAIDDIYEGKHAKSFVTDTQGRTNQLSALINDKLRSGYFTIDDVIVDPSVLHDNVKSEIIQFAKTKYGAIIDSPNSQFTFLYLRDYFLTKYKTTTIVLNQSGEYVLASVENVNKVFTKPDVKITVDSKLTDIIKSRYIPDGLKYVITDQVDSPMYLPYKTENGVTVFDNTIYVNKGLFNESQDYIRFAIAHELQHAYQFNNNMNLGMNYQWLSNVEVNQRNEIIADVREHVPYLFKGVPKGSIAEFKIVNDYVYNATGEAQAYGLEGLDVMDFVPVLSKNTGNVLTIVFPWNKSYTIKNIQKADTVSSIWKKVTDNLFSFTELTDLYADVNMDTRIDDWRIQEGINRRHKSGANIGLMQKIRDDEEYQDKVFKLKKYLEDISPNAKAFDTWRRLPMNTNKPLSEDFKINLKKNLTKKDRLASLELLRLTVAPDIELNEFMNTDVNFVRMQKRGHLGDSPFVSIYAGATRDSVKFCLESFANISSHPNDVLDTNIIIGTFKPKDLLVYFGGTESEILIEPSKITNSKIFKCNNKFVAKNDAINYVVFAFDDDGEIIIDPEAVYFTSTGSFGLTDGTTGEIRFESIPENLPVYKFRERPNDYDALINIYDEIYARANELRDNKEKFELASCVDDGNIYYNVIRHKGAITFSTEILDTLYSDTNLEVYVTDNKGRKITPEETATSLVDLEKMYGMSLAPRNNKIPAPKVNELAEDDPRAEHFLKGEESGHKNYLVRYLVIDENGNQVFRSGKERDYPLYHYYYADEKTKTRKVGQRKWKGTKLEPFTKKYEVTQLSKEFQDFILNAEGLDPALQDKIDGKLKGTLTENEVMSYLRSKDNIDDVTFRAINKAFFKNEYIDSFKELTDIIRDAPDAWALWRTIKNTAGLRNVFKSLDDREISLDTIRDIVLSNKIDLTEEGVEKSTKKPSERYEEYVYEYTTVSNKTGDKSLEVPEHYMRLSLMKHYDGSITTMRDAASAARVASLSLKWEVTPKDDRWNQEFHDAYTDVVESFDDMTDDDIITALFTRKATELKEKYSNDYDKFKAESLAYRLNLMKLSRQELINLFGGHDGLTNALVESVVVDATGQYVKINEEAKPKARTYVDRMKGAARTIKKRLTGEEQAKLVKKYPNLFNDDLTPKKELYQNMVKNKSRRSGEHPVYKDLEEVISAFEQINEIKNEVLLEHRSIKRELELERKVHRETMRQLKKLEQGVKNDGKTPHVVEIVTDDTVEHLVVEKDMPLQMMKMLQVHYNNTAKTKVQNLSSETDRHKKRVANNFYENADEILLHLTQADVDDIIDFMVNGVVNLNDATAPYQVAEMLIMTYFIEVGRTGTVKLRGKNTKSVNPMPVNFVISEKQLAALEDLLEKRISRPATVLATWRHVLHQLDPVQTIIQSIARRSGVTPTKEEVKKLLDAVKTGETEKIKSVKKEVYDALRDRAIEARKDRKSFDKFIDTLLQWERLAMLSAPGTWIRNTSSNTIVKGAHWTADKIMPGLDAVLYKLFPKSAAVKGQYKIAGTSIDKNVADYIDIKLKKSGLLDLSIEGVSKYDVRKSIKDESEVMVLTEMLARAATNVANASNLFVEKKVDKNDPLFTKIGKHTANAFPKMESLLRKAISDDPWVKKATLAYLGKMITEDIASGKIDSVTDFMPDGSISNEFLVYVAEAYKLAAYDYMHRNNALLEFESKLAAKNFYAYAAYKQFLPFAGVGWNWFVEGLNYTPIGLVKSIVNFAKLENTVEKFDEARMKFKHGEVGISSSFAAYVTKRNITKGTIGTIGLIAGVLLAAFGVARIDEEDDKYKIIVGDVAVDISDIFGTQGILLGIAVASGVRNQDSFADICVAALDQAFMDSTFSDVFNTFRYNETFGEALAYQMYAIPNMMIPNMLKFISSVATPYDVKFSNGILGKIERLAVNALPGLSYALPHYYDPYTGEKQVSQKLWFLTKMVDKLTPLGLSIYNVSELEKMAIKYSINKTQLTGRYTINDKNVKLDSSDIEKLNMYYGQLNVTDFKEVQSDRITYKIQQPNGSYKKLRWSQMTEKEKAAVISRIMTNNSNLAKIYILTDSNNYKYYATEAEYKELRSLGITKNVYKATGNKKGFVEN